MSHTKEPWGICEAGDYVYINAAGAGYIGNLTIHPHRAEEIRANARRIVACVNACADVQTEFLEQISVDKLRRDWLELKQQRDELLAALEGIVPYIAKSSAADGGAAKYSAAVVAADAVRTAIAKVKP